MNVASHKSFKYSVIPHFTCKSIHSNKKQGEVHFAMSVSTFMPQSRIPHYWRRVTMKRLKQEIRALLNFSHSHHAHKGTGSENVSLDPSFQQEIMETRGIIASSMHNELSWPLQSRKRWWWCSRPKCNPTREFLILLQSCLKVSSIIRR